ncbi:ankyrin repeat domain containing protein 37, partial [Sarcoptes scabiei]
MTSINRRHLQPAIREKINNALHSEELLLDGYGPELIGRTSYDEEARKFLKSVPHLMDTIDELHKTSINGDQENVMKILRKNQHLARTRDGNGFTPFHHAIIKNHLDLVNYFVEHFPWLINLKDN